MLILPSGGSGRYYKIPPVIPGTFEFLFSGKRGREGRREGGKDGEKDGGRMGGREREEEREGNLGGG